MANSKRANQKKTSKAPARSQGKAESDKKSTMPIWGWVLIVIAVVVGGYLLIQKAIQELSRADRLPLEISAAEAAKLDKNEWFFLDVREPDEWEQGHISYATLIPLGQLTSRLSEIPKDKNIVVVCRSGNRSAVGRDQLLEAGFKYVTSMAGGMKQWRTQGSMVVTGP